jgi:excisionase family DNA binding protein
MTDRLEAAIRELAEALLEAARTEADAGPRPPDRLLSVDEAAATLGLGRSRIYAEIAAGGRLRTVKVGRRRLVPAAAVAEFIARAADA